MATPINLKQGALPQGFVVAPTEEVHRMLLATQGLDRTGKTEFALSAPAPIAYVSLDIGTEGVIEKWSKRKKVWVAEFNVPPLYDDNPQYQTVMTPKTTYLQYWNKVKEAYHRALDHSDVRTVVVDTASEMWELMRLAEFGQLSPAADIRRAYNSLNALYRGLIRSAYDTDKNLILIHKLKKEYVKTVKTTSSGSQEQDVWKGDYLRAGFGETGYLIQSNLEHRYENGQFSIRVLNCRQNMSIAGLEFPQVECSFSDIGVAVFEGTSKEDWK